MNAQQTATKSLTIPAREVRPGDVLFGMTVVKVDADLTRPHTDLVYIEFPAGGARPVGDYFWMVRSQKVTVERPVPSDPIGTVRVWLHEDSGDLIALYRKVGPNAWRVDGSPGLVEDSYVDRHPILWKPGMPIPSEGAK